MRRLPESSSDEIESWSTQVLPRLVLRNAGDQEANTSVHTSVVFTNREHLGIREQVAILKNPENARPKLLSLSTNSPCPLFVDTHTYWTVSWTVVSVVAFLTKPYGTRLVPDCLNHCLLLTQKHSGICVKN